MGAGGMPNMNMNMNSQMMLDNFKSMMLTMAMVKGSSQTDSKNSFMNTILLMLVVSFIDTFVLQAKKMFSIISNKVECYITKNTSNIAILNNITSSYLKTKKSSIIIKIEGASKNPTSDAVIDILTHLPHTKCILLQNGTYTINYSEEIELSKGLYARLVNSSSSQMISQVNESQNNDGKELQDVKNTPATPATPSTDTDESRLAYIYIDIYSYVMYM